jgi:hypothetical protein
VDASGARRLLLRAAEPEEGDRALRDLRVDGLGVFYWRARVMSFSAQLRGIR